MELCKKAQLKTIARCTGVATTDQLICIPVVYMCVYMEQEKYRGSSLLCVCDGLTEQLCACGQPFGAPCS